MGKGATQTGRWSYSGFFGSRRTKKADEMEQKAAEPLIALRSPEPIGLDAAYDYPSGGKVMSKSGRRNRFQRSGSRILSFLGLGQNSGSSLKVYILLILIS